MKKFVIVFFMIFAACCFLNAQEDDFGWLDSFQNEDEMIADENGKALQEKQEIEKEKEKVKKQKKQNKNASIYFGVAANVPFNTGGASDSNSSGSSFPLGVSLHGMGNSHFLTLKGNVSWDFVKLTAETPVIFSFTLSGGISPVYNDFCFIGLYGTFGGDTIGDFTYTSYGGSATVLFNFTERLGIFINCDALYRQKASYKGSEETEPVSSFSGTWRICPSIGISYNFLRS